MQYKITQAKANRKQQCYLKRFEEFVTSLAKR